MPWEYSQSTGRLSHNGETAGQGYSGMGMGKNNSKLESVKDVGPIPKGKYKIGKPRTSQKTGKHVMDLNPDGHNAWDRPGLQIHGEKISGPAGSASTGCVVLERSIRERISSSGDNILIVVE